MPVNVEILYEDNHLLAINKPGGFLVQGDQTHDEPLVDVVKDYLKREYNKTGNVYLGVVHRLDRPVTGCLLFAKTSKALSRMNEQLRRKKIEKTYWAVLSKRPPKIQDRLVHYLVKNPQANFVRAYSYNKEDLNSKKAQLSYELFAEIGQFHLVKIFPLTGRPHQIRTQMAAIGCPILSDTKYGAVKKENDRYIYLHARSLRFIHPTKKEDVLITAPLPQDPIWKTFSDFEED